MFVTGLARDEHGGEESVFEVGCRRPCTSVPRLPVVVDFERFECFVEGSGEEPEQGGEWPEESHVSCSDVLEKAFGVHATHEPHERWMDAVAQEALDVLAGRSDAFPTDRQ